MSIEGWTFSKRREQNSDSPAHGQISCLQQRQGIGRQGQRLKGQLEQTTTARFVNIKVYVHTLSCKCGVVSW